MFKIKTIFTGVFKQSPGPAMLCPAQMSGWGAIKPFILLIFFC